MAIEKIVCEIICLSVNCESDKDWVLSILGNAVNSFPSRPAILNTEFSQVITVLFLKSVSIVTSTSWASGNLLMISEKIFDSNATLPGSTILPSQTVSIPNSVSFPTSCIFPLDASRRIHSNIDIVVFDGTAFDTIFIAFVRSLFLNCNFIKQPFL